MNRKVVLVTGSSIGLGKCIIEKYASNNYDVVIHYLNHENEAKKLQKSLEDLDAKIADEYNKVYWHGLWRRKQK